MNNIVLGFTGTREGMSDRQMYEIHLMLQDLWQRGAREFHHGDCVGSDAQAHVIAESFGYHVHIHPPEDDRFQAFCKPTSGTVYAPAPYLVRDQAIVDACDILIATPQQEQEIHRSGTWATIRMGLASHREVWVIRP